MDGLQLVPFDATVARTYGPIGAQRERYGQWIGPYALMIAAQARALDAVLVTGNVDEFSRVEGLAVENWLA